MKFIHQLAEIFPDFKGLSEGDESFISSLFCEMSYVEGEIIMKKGEPADTLMFIKSGRTQVIDGDVQIAANSSGDIIGENIFVDDGVRSADVVALEDTTVGVFTLDDFKIFLDAKRLLALSFRNSVVNIRNLRLAANQGRTYIDTNKYLALIAHNEMKSTLMDFCRDNKNSIARFPLVATGTTGSLLYKQTGMVLSHKVASGPLGGDQAVGKLISTQNILAVIFFRDPLSAHPHHADIEALGRLCDVYQIPFATNPSTAQAVLNFVISSGSQSSSPNNYVMDKYNSAQQQVLK